MFSEIQSLCFQVAVCHKMCNQYILTIFYNLCNNVNHTKSQMEP